MSRRASFFRALVSSGSGVLSLALLPLALLALGGCLLADVGIDPALDPDMTVSAAQGGGSGNGNGNGTGGSASTPAGAGGGSGAGVMAPTAGSGGEGGSAGSGGMPTGGGEAGSADMPPMGGSAGAAGNGGGATSAIELAATECPDSTDRERLCTLYCDAYEAMCRDYSPAAGVAGPYDYQNATDCAVFCNLDSGWELGSNSQLDSIKCRCFHAVLAEREGPNPHCFHAARIPSGGCQPAN